MAGKKIKLGTVRVTTKRQIQVSRKVTYTAQTRNTGVSHIEANSRLMTVPSVRVLPQSAYSSPQVDVLYNEIQKHTKPQELSANDMYDVFISHASEDKKDFVDPLVQSLQDAGIRVWYDTLEMQWGKSLREQIDNGIKRSKYAILVLSKSFFAKDWPQRELDGILAKQGMTKVSPLPIWYNITAEEVYDFSPTLSGLYSLSTDKFSIEDICKAFKKVLGNDSN